MNALITAARAGLRLQRPHAAPCRAKRALGHVLARMVAHTRGMRRACERLVLALSLTGLAACSTVPPAPMSATALALPRWAQVHTEKRGQPAQDTLLAVQAQPGGAMRWSMFDPLGMPQARQIFQDGHWRNDGFMRPNGAATELFSAILFAWTPSADLPLAYAGQDWREQPDGHGGAIRIMDDRCATRWRVNLDDHDAPKRISIELGDGTRVSVAPLPAPQAPSSAPSGGTDHP